MLQAAASRFPWFEALSHGDLSHYGGDESRADFGLVKALARFTDDREQIDRIFRQSGLMRGKWDSARGQSTYGWQTIDRVLSR